MEEIAETRGAGCCWAKLLGSISQPTVRNPPGIVGYGQESPDAASKLLIRFEVGKPPSGTRPMTVIYPASCRALNRTLTENTWFSSSMAAIEQPHYEHASVRSPVAQVVHLLKFLY